MASMRIVKHTLPGEGGACSWFDRLNEFEKAETVRQVEFKRNVLQEPNDGTWSKRPGYTYPHIMPDLDLGRVLYGPIARAVQDYCGRNDIAVHTEALNLRSSQICCFNFLFPLRMDLVLAARALGALLPGVTEVFGIEFEYDGGSGATDWLGEARTGKRGQNRTSIDAVIWWKSRLGSFLTLVEWKYTERSFGTCGGYVSNGNSNKSACTDLSCRDYLAQPRYCYLDSKHRRYWSLLDKAGVDLSNIEHTTGCPFRGPFYQLLRQHLLAAYLRICRPVPDMSDVDDVYVAAVHFSGNEALAAPYVLGDTCFDNIITAWNSLLVSVPPMRSVQVDDLAAELRQQAGSQYRDLLVYLSNRYGL